ncbi:MAG: pyridoxamine 5'-phosphate oxidase family protein [Desulfovibrio sp.]|jgi:uncharacterized pyridoxamine 5'-phosphate oxidase family protein|nr:pyridoxamine 5'-phosphate oxidase family protein [Desulfovibrio sp.]
MKRVCTTLAFMFAVVLFSAFLSAGTLSAAVEATADVKVVHDFLKKCGTYYIATVDGDQPRVRPFSSLGIYEGKIYFQTGRKKDVSKQMAKNPKIEICAYDGEGEWIRIAATAVNDDRREAKQFMLDAHPSLKSMYSADDNNTQVLYLKDATARFYSFKGEPKVIKF